MDAPQFLSIHDIFSKYLFFGQGETDRSITTWLFFFTASATGIGN
jgi:hypothetical protein